MMRVISMFRFEDLIITENEILMRVYGTNREFTEEEKHCLNKIKATLKPPYTVVRVKTHETNSLQEFYNALVNGRIHQATQ